MGRLNYKYQKKEASTPASPASSAPVLLFEKRVLTYVTFLLFLGLAIWMVAVFTDYWIVVVGHQKGNAFNFCAESQLLGNFSKQTVSVAGLIF